MTRITMGREADTLSAKGDVCWWVEQIPGASALYGALNGATQHFVLDAEGGVYVEEQEEPSTFKTTKMQNRPKRVKSLVKVWTSFRSRLFTVWLRTVAKDPISEGLCACVASTG